MIDLVRKRHDGDGWIVFEELGDKPGLYRNRTADAVALGVWASKKYEAHLYEFKISREDLKRELRDPKKAEGVGKYCHYWWIVVDDEKRLTDLAIPDIWGIMVVREDKVGGKVHRRLSVHRKAPKLTPQPFSHLFAVSAIRNIRKGYVDPTDHRKLEEELAEIKFGTKRQPTEDDLDKDEQIAKLKRELQHMKDYVARFEERSGVKLDAPSWEWGNIGAAVSIVLELGEMQTHGRGDVRQHVAALSKASEEMEQQARELAKAAVTLRALAPSTECAASCPSRSRWGRGRCNCGAQPLSEVERKIAGNAPISSSSSPPRCSFVVATGIHCGDPCEECGALSCSSLGTAPPAPPAAVGSSDDEGSGVDRRCAGAPEQDAGVQLRDQCNEVPHGQ